MTRELWSVAFGSSLITIAVMFGSLRLLPWNQTRRVLWWLTRLPALAASGLTLAAIIGTAALISSGAPVSNSRGVETQMSALSDFSSLPGNQIGEVVKPNSDAKVRALANLRDYSNRISSKQKLFVGMDSDDQPASATAGLPDVEIMIDRLAKRAAENPGNVSDLSMLGWSYVSTGKYADGIKAYRQAIALDPGNQKLAAALAEAETMLEAKSQPSTNNN